jgi:hypothetical protein
LRKANIKAGISFVKAFSPVNNWRHSKIPLYRWTVSPPESSGHPDADTAFFLNLGIFIGIGDSLAKRTFEIKYISLLRNNCIFRFAYIQ